MTVCIYKNNALYADGRCTSGGGILINDDYTKIGAIYEDTETGLRSILPENLDNPKLFAIYGFAGQLDHLQKFLRWFVSVPLHPIIDAEIDESFDDPLVTVSDEVGIQALVVFNDYDIVREYTNSYESHLYIDFKKSDFVVIGSGTVPAMALHSSDSTMNPLDILKHVCKTSLTCGGTLKTISLEQEEKLVTKQIIVKTNEASDTVFTKLKNYFKKK